MEFSVLDILLIVILYVLLVYAYDYYLSNHNKLSRIYGILKEVKQDNYDDYLNLPSGDVPTRRERRRRSSVYIR
uniref:Putative transmembrane protein n=1 Tax=Persimmon virus B TaxID=1493829 RepID=A0A0A8JEP0_9CLOS|nr:putative transmembrane protein [Persimmon virus B]